MMSIDRTIYLNWPKYIFFNLKSFFVDRNIFVNWPKYLFLIFENSAKKCRFDFTPKIGLPLNNQIVENIGYIGIYQKNVGVILGGIFHLFIIYLHNLLDRLEISLQVTPTFFWKLAIVCTMQKYNFTRILRAV